uniref:Uncharacterized protein n=1 Tax=Linum usitatissimum TaxID=4006 RepID=A0A172MLC6_LINUS|nr:hypothetical protein [Linum usitatissimum]
MRRRRRNHTVGMSDATEDIYTRSESAENDSKPDEILSSAARIGRAVSGLDIFSTTCKRDMVVQVKGIQERKNEKEFNQQLANSSMEFKCRSEISGNYNSMAAYLGYMCLEEETKRK